MEDENIQVDEKGHIDARYLGWTHIEPIIWTFSGNLLDLDLSFNNIQYLPERLGSLHHLKRLDCSCNIIEKLPKNFGNLRNLQELKANGNKLTDLPNSIGECISLRTLNVSENQLEYIPDSIGCCISLTNIFLQNNNLSSVPFTLAQLKDTIKHINLSNNSSLSCMIPEQKQNDTIIIMWILSTHYYASLKIMDIRRATREMGEIFQLNEQSSNNTHSRIEKIQQERRKLLLEQQSNATYLHVRDLFINHKNRLRKLSSHCKFLLQKKMSKISFSRK